MSTLQALASDMSLSDSSVEPIMTANPRRKPAHESVSLRQPSTESNRIKFQEVNPKTQNAAGSIKACSLHTKRKESGESSNAESWFEKSNQHISSVRPGLVESKC